MEYQKELLREVDEIVRENALIDDEGYRLTLDEVCADDQKKLIAIMLKQSKMHGEDFEAITENRNEKEIENAFYTMLNDYTHLNMVLFADIMTRSLLSYYRRRIEILLSARVSIIEAQEREEYGYCLGTDEQTGESFWVKRFAL